MRQVREDLPSGFYRRLPRLETPEAEENGLPRTFCLAHTLLSATHLQPSLSAAVQFVDAYQTDAPLTIAELWAFPTMLRLACLEILVSAAARIFPTLAEPFHASRWISLFESLEPTERVARALTSLAAIDRSRGRTSLIASAVWKQFCGRTRLRSTRNMDFDTRDRYRNAVENSPTARQAGVGSRKRCTRTGAFATMTGRRPCRLLAAGRWPHSIEALLGYRTAPGAVAPLAVTPCRRMLCVRVASSELAITSVPAVYLVALQASPMDALVRAGIAPASILSATLVQWIVMLIVPPRVLPKLNSQRAYRPIVTTAVGVPAIVGARGSVGANRTAGDALAHQCRSACPLCAAERSDRRAARAHDGDAAIEAALVDGIRELNERHAAPVRLGFPSAPSRAPLQSGRECWMGWERKRGKLEQFNRFVLGEADDFALKEGDSGVLRGVRFVVTADADTMLPRGSLHRLVSTLAHPLNHAEFDAEPAACSEAIR